MSMELHTLIASLSGSSSISKTLQSLSSCKIPSNYGKTVVVENGGADSNRSLVNSFHDTLNTYYIHNPQGGKCKALNTAIQHLNDGLIFFSDDDIRFDDRVLAAYNRAGRKYGRGHFFGGPFNIRYEISPPEWLQDYLPPSARGCWFEGTGNIDFYFTDFLGFNWAAFTSDIKQAGGFDPKRGPGSVTGSTGDETDMQRRLVESGCEARYVPGARVTHYVPEECCTPLWTLNRSFQNGVKDGLNYAREESHESIIPPIWLIKANINHLIGMIYNINSRLDFFEERYLFKYHTGFAKGVYFGGSDFRNNALE